ncbi:MULTISPECIES: GPW/gp25 family protein [Wolbachia]|uniref:GPW/gp25 family protein n=1 Tax=Wolbachia TaxID=953 RepID=UPI00004CA56A|nr:MULTISPECIES: GPW/gp25 family protein [Wolbachia]MDX5488274.1 GPW/gp25 family protein [Wolbachia endosymbiont of Andrena praecox]MDX5497687.1 GPW/gp25 family protein [Wolbachia endosymbiont of Lasioglossum nitidulum]MDX5561581.1 GPW/gp25 family protein [Wolbachia endosymbiont of Andrena bicolor]MDX5596697.1 GPW/gp25 family protein [Wolbachia endosymbiont of Andrena labialis]POG51508.1 baseplate assembly protein W [Wolbachia sp. wRi_2]QHJ75402.1 baseplate assembly protein [Wolbachia phage W
MRGMSNKTGKELEGIEHLKQSIIDILTTPIGSRIMRREYGSRLFELIDRPINRDFSLEIYAATAEALGKWEKRFKLEKVKITEVKEGRVTLDLEGVYLSEGKFININGVVV